MLSYGLHQQPSPLRPEHPGGSADGHAQRITVGEDSGTTVDLCI